jgi:hypothetical protein
MNHQPPTPPSRDGSPDLLLQRYAEANALDESRPGPALRENVLAHARMQAAAHAKSGSANATPPSLGHQKPAANDSAWTLRALGSVAVLGLVGQLILQFDRGTPQDRELALGRTSPSTAAAPAPAPAAKPVAPQAAETPQAMREAAPAPAEQSAELSDKAPPPAPSLARVPTPKAPERERATNSKRSAPASIEPPEPASLADAASAAPPGAAPVPFPASPAAPPAATNEAFSAPPVPQAAPLQPETPAAAAMAPPTSPARRLNPPAPAAAARSRLAAGDVQKSPSSEDRAEPPGAAAPNSDPGRTLLAAAAQNDALQAVRDALAQGAQVNAARPDGRTALMLAAERGDAALIRLLLDAGADPQRLDREGLNAADWARRSGQTQVLPLLQPPHR